MKQQPILDELSAWRLNSEVDQLSRYLDEEYRASKYKRFMHAAMKVVPEAWEIG